MSEEPDVSARDALQVAQRALSKANELERENVDLRERVADLEDDMARAHFRLAEIDEQRPYDGLTRNEKIGMVREHAFTRAAEGRGSATLDYNDVMWSVFDGEPGTHHCYDLMQWASEARGFEVRDPAKGSKHLYVDAAEARRGAVFSENKAPVEGGR